MSDAPRSRYHDHCTIAAVVYEEEKALLEAAAAARGMSMSTWLRIAALSFAGRGPVVDLLAAAVRADEAFSHDEHPDHSYAHEILDESAFRFAETLTTTERQNLLRLGTELNGACGVPLRPSPYTIEVAGVEVGCDTPAEAIAIADSIVAERDAEPTP